VILVETWTLIRYRLGRRAAERYWEGLRNGAAILEMVGAADLEAAWQIGTTYRDRDALWWFCSDATARYGSGRLFRR
jgi:hypothetical protein